MEFQEEKKKNILSNMEVVYICGFLEETTIKQPRDR